MASSSSNQFKSWLNAQRTRVANQRRASADFQVPWAAGRLSCFFISIWHLSDQHQADSDPFWACLQVILALSERRRDHIPYRSSKLTHVLRDSLGGNCKTRLIACIWSDAAQLDESLSTCRSACPGRGLSGLTPALQCLCC